MSCAYISMLASLSQLPHHASLKIPLSYQAIYQYLLDNLVSGPSFVPTVIAALHPSNRCEACVTNFIRPYLHQFFINSHGLNGYGKPLKRPFDRY